MSRIDTLKLFIAALCKSAWDGAVDSFNSLGPMFLWTEWMSRRGGSFYPERIVF